MLAEIVSPQTLNEGANFLYLITLTLPFVIAHTRFWRPPTKAEGGTTPRSGAVPDGKQAPSDAFDIKTYAPGDLIGFSGNGENTVAVVHAHYNITAYSDHNFGEATVLLDANHKLNDKAAQKILATKGLSKYK